MDKKQTGGIRAAVGDEVFFHHKKQPCCGRVLAVGEHGATIDADGKRHRVPWHGIAGHKKRAPQKYTVIHEGEDGVIAEGPDGKRRYLAVGADRREDQYMTKSIGGRRLILFAKAGPIANRPGLTQKKITDSTGRQQTKWVRIDKGHQADHGQHLGFVNGEHKGYGEVTRVGQHGVVIKDNAGGEHRVPHDKLTHHWTGDDAPDHSPHDIDYGDGGGTEQPAPAAEQRQFFDDADVADLPDSKTWRHSAFSSWEEAIAMAEPAHKEYHAMLQGLAKELGIKEMKMSPDDMTDEMLSNGDRFLFMGPIKKQDKASKKVDTDYEGDWGGLKDLVRATIAVSDVEDVHALLAGLKKAGVKMAQKPKDNMTHGTKDGYRDINMVVYSGGMPVELQVHVKSITKAKGEAHHYYNDNIAIEQRNKAAGNHAFESWSEADQKSFNENRARQNEIYGAAWNDVLSRQKNKLTETPKDSSKPLQKALYSNMIIFVRRKEKDHAVR